MKEDSSRRVEDRPPQFLAFAQRVFFVLGVGVVAWVFFSSRQVILMGLTSAILAVIFGGLATVLSRMLPWQHRKWGYRLALLLVLLASGSALLGLGMSFGPRVISEIGTLRLTIPDAVKNLETYPIFRSFFSQESQGANGVSQLLPVLSSTALSMASGLLGLITAAFLIVFTAVFLAADPFLYKGAILSAFPVARRQRASQVLDACARGLWRWLLGQAFAMALIGLLTTAGLFLIRMEYALTLGLMAGLLQFFPYIGPYLSALPAVLVAVTVSPQMVLWVILLYFVIQVVEGNLVTPFVLQNKANLPPAFTLFSTVIFGVVFGFLGVIVATPLSVLLLVLYQELYQKEVLGLEIHSAGSEQVPRTRFRRPPGTARELHPSQPVPPPPEKD